MVISKGQEVIWSPYNFIVGWCIWICIELQSILIVVDSSGWRLQYLNTLCTSIFGILYHLQSLIWKVEFTMPYLAATQYTCHIPYMGLARLLSLVLT